MPRASANIMREVHRPDRDVPNCVAMKSEPAALTRPSDRQHQRQARGDERAEREHEDAERHRPAQISSDFIIASLFALLKSAHMPEAPVRSTSTPAAGRPRERPVERRPRRDHAVRVRRRRRPGRSAVCPSCGDRRPLRRRDDRRDGVAAGEHGLDARDAWPERRVGDGLVRRECTTTISPALERPRNSAWISSRAFDRLRAVRLPAGARERLLGPRREDAEREGDDDPGGEDDPEVAWRSSGRAARSGRGRRHRTRTPLQATSTPRAGRARRGSRRRRRRATG